MKMNESKYSAKTGKPYDKDNPRPQSVCRYWSYGYTGKEKAIEFVQLKPLYLGNNYNKRVKRAQRVQRLNATRGR